MNEVTKIHLGRQAFTISVDAHHELKNYLRAIEKQVNDKEVVDEVELRMAELLAEHGINANKVILPADVSFLKEQLGNPADFKDNDDASELTDKPTDSKRLFRDTDNAMLAGVAAGLAKYFGIDALLIRLLFVFIVFVTAGGGILLYILLWLLVPEAKTPSDHLQMAGKPVTVDSLKEIVENADVKGAAHRANAALTGPVNTLFRFILRLIGLAFVLTGLGILFGLITGEAYFLSRGSTWMQVNIFPSGVRENLVLHLAAAVAALMAVFIILFGVAIFRRKWPIRTWITGVLAGLIFIGMAVGGALAADVYPTVHARYNANLHSTTRVVQPFTAVNANNLDVSLDYQVSDRYYVALSYYDHPNLAPVKTIVQNGILIIDTGQFNELRNCQTLCLPDTYDLTITVYSPNAINLENQYSTPVTPTLPKPVSYPQ
jgi:phage shock protein PspC (stress-responsive transcriptional regulator)